MLPIKFAVAEQVHVVDGNCEDAALGHVPAGKFGDALLEEDELIGVRELLHHLGGDAFFALFNHLIR